MKSVALILFFLIWIGVSFAVNCKIGGKNYAAGKVTETYCLGGCMRSDYKIHAYGKLRLMVIYPGLWSRVKITRVLLPSLICQCAISRVWTLQHVFNPRM